MKNLLSVTLLLLVLASCNSNGELEKKKNELSKKESELALLKQEIETLKKEIEVLDPSSVIERSELVTVQEVAKEEFKKFIEAQATTYAENNIKLTTDLGGLVTKVNVQIGDYVPQGKVLVQLDNQLILNQISELQTALNLAKDVYDKRNRLWQQNIGSEIEYLQAKNNYESLQASMQTAQTQLSKTSIKAPISGYVDNVMVKIGEMVAPGTPAVQLVNLSKMEVRADLPEIYLKSIEVGDEVELEIPVLGKTKKAKVTAIGQNINQTNRTFQVVATINNPDGEVKPNLLAKIKVNDITVKDAVIIPTRLLQESSKGYFVYVAEKDANGDYRAKKVDIEIAESYEAKMVVSSGLKGGEMLIDLGYRNVLEGQLLDIKEAR